ncbi:MAG: hypothetical protein ACI4TB_05430 [Lachnospiraceae bacterium]
MKKRLLALVSALVLASAMSMTTLAAGSVSTSSVAESSADAALATATQQFTAATIEEFAKTTTVSSSVDATITAVSTDTAKAAIAEAKTTVGENAFVATIVDLNVPAGTGEATFTVGCPNVWAGQNVTVLHQKADGAWESITPSNVADNAVTFTLTSYSPIAIVINATAPKTGDMVMVVAGLAVICLAGIAIFGKKAKLN